VEEDGLVVVRVIVDHDGNRMLTGSDEV